MTAREMGATVHPRGAVKRAIVMLQAFFDEAGTSGGKDGSFLLTGYLAPEAEWTKFEEKWGALLKHPCSAEKPPPKNSEEQAKIVCRPLEYLHAQEMEGMGKGRFRGIGQKNRNHLIRSSVTTIINSGVIGIGLAIQLSAYEDIEDAAKAILGDPYYVCFQAVIVEAAIQSKMFLGENPHENIAFVFERNPIWELRLHEMYQRMIKEGLGPRYRMGALTFAEKKEFMPLQAADRLCYELYKNFVEQEHRPQLDRLESWPQHHGRRLDHAGMPLFIEELRASGKLK